MGKMYFPVQYRSIRIPVLIEMQYISMNQIDTFVLCLCRPGRTFTGLTVLLRICHSKTKQQNNRHQYHC